MKIAVTGASGYVGGCIADSFRSQGHEVLALSRRQCPGPWLSFSLGDDPRQLPWNGVDALVHAAYDFTARSWSDIVDRNVNPSIELFQAAARANVKRLIFISSMSCFEGCRSDYGKAKWMIENKGLELGVAAIRPGLVWGGRSGGVMGTLEKLVAAFPVIPFLFGGKNLRQYLIHEADLAEAVVAIAAGPTSGAGSLHSIYHPTPVTILQIFKIIAKRSNRSRVYVPVPWQLAMSGLKLAEFLNIRLSFRSDSLVGLVHGNPQPELTPPPAGMHYRAFE